MSKIKVKQINDPDTKVAINSGLEIIEHIKRKIAACNDEDGSCQVEVFDMWDEK